MNINDLQGGEYMTSALDWDEFFMRHVYLVASKSKDPSTKIGAILVKNGTIISEGYNGFPRGVKDFVSRYLDKDIKYSMVVHGEMNAILNAVRNGISTYGTILYTQTPPCQECSKSIIQAGISELIVHKQWGHMANWMDSQRNGIKMLQEAKISTRVYDSILNITCLISGKLIDV